VTAESASNSNAAFLEPLRLMLAHETAIGLELAFATPRAWLAPAKWIAVVQAPTSFGRALLLAESPTRPREDGAVVSHHGPSGPVIAASPASTRSSELTTKLTSPHSNTTNGDATLRQPRATNSTTSNKQRYIEQTALHRPRADETGVLKHLQHDPAANPLPVASRIERHPLAIGGAMVIRIFLFGGLALAATAGVVAAATKAGPIMGPASKVSTPAFHGFYDGHRSPI
jgi:hypothetical protein